MLFNLCASDSQHEHCVLRNKCVVAKEKKMKKKQVAKN